MKALHVFKTYYPDTQGGIEEVIRQICRNSQDFGIENRIYTLSAATSKLSVINAEGTEVYRNKRWFQIASCDVGYPGALLNFKKMADWADIIHYHFPWPFADFMHAICFLKKPSVVTYHSDIVRQKKWMGLYKPLMHRFLKSVSRIVATSPHYLATSDVLTRYTDKVDIIPIGIDESSYPKISESKLSMVKTQYGEGFYLYVGVLRYYKGLHILLEAMRNSLNRVIIVGTGAEEAELKEKVKCLKINNVTFTGFVDEETKIALIKLCRAIVFPSHLRSEAFGVTLLEGAMLQKPLICADIGTGTTHINKDGVTGLVVTPDSSTEICQAMEKLSQNNQLCTRLGKGARKRFDDHFTAERMRKGYREVYKDCLAR